MTEWPDYLEGFHEENAGITEDLLSRSLGPGDEDPYEWLARGARLDGLVVDVGCGSGPMAPMADRWVGVDLSPGELRRARLLNRGPLIEASSAALPVGGGAAAVVVAAMSLMVVDHPQATLREAARVLSPGGRLAVLVPARGPTTLADRLRYGLLFAALGRATPPFPQPDLAVQLTERLEAAGFRVLIDEARRFVYPIETPADADLFVRSLYLPDVSARRVRLAASVARRWEGAHLGIPLRRVIAARNVGHETQVTEVHDQRQAARERARR